MWERIVGRLPSNIIMFSAILSVVIPIMIYKLNQKFHQYGDPPWRKKH